MLGEKALLRNKTAAQLSLGGDNKELVSLRGFYEFECFRNGRKIWTDEINNLVVNLGRNNVLQNYFKGSAYTAGHAVGLVNASPTIAAADSMASKAWAEVVDYDEASRPDLTALLDDAANQQITHTNAIVFSINSANTIGGLFVVGGSARATKGDITANSLLISAGAFSGGNRSVQDGDTINATVTYSF